MNTVLVISTTSCSSLSKYLLYLMSYTKILEKILVTEKSLF